MHALTLLLRRWMTLVEADTNSAAFRSWFAGSKVVDQHGQPLKMFHGTTADDFTHFHPGSHFGTVRAANQRVGFRQRWPDAGGSRVIPVYLRITKPLRVTDLESADEAALLNAIARGKYPALDVGVARQEGAYKAAQDAGYDGLVYNNHIEDRGKLSYVIFHPDQVRSAIAEELVDHNHQPSMSRDTMVELVTAWFADHQITPKANLASPLEIVALPHTEDIRVRVRNWPEGQVDALTRYKALHADFKARLATLGWHITMVSRPSRVDLGEVAEIKVAPNYPSQPVEVPRILHHHTATKNVESILRQGLQPRSQRPGDQYPPRVYLMVPHGRGAWEASTMLSDESPEGAAILQVDTSRMPGATFYADPELPDAGVWTYTPVPADAIRSLVPMVK